MTRPLSAGQRRPMTQLPFRCPVCVAAGAVPDLTSAAATHCAQCGLVFTPIATSGDGVNASRPRISDQLPYVPPVANLAGAEPPRSDAPPAVTVDPPPPYVPLANPARPTPPRAEMTPTPPEVSVNIRVVGALGLPPPYRPGVAAEPVFARGPAPDLEPWRLVSLASRMAERDPTPDPAAEGDAPANPHWSLNREPDPAAEAVPLAQETRFETGEVAGPRDLPVVWPPGSEGPRMLPASRYDARRAGQGVAVGAAFRMRRPAFWAAGIGIAVIGLGVALYVGRQEVTRVFPSEAPVAAARGPADGPPSSTGNPDAASPSSAARRDVSRN